jgi:nicotinamidase-related amidase
MQDIDGKRIYSTLQEIVEPSHTAIVVWDVQNLLVDSIFKSSLRNINLLIESARRSKINILYSYRNAAIEV